MSRPSLGPVEAPISLGADTIGRLLLDLTAYLVGPSVAEFDWMCAQYEAAVDAANRLRYLTPELQLWQEVRRPNLTASGRRAASAGGARPYFEPCRQRIRDDRAFFARYWDGTTLEAPEAMFTFNCGAIRKKDSGTHGYVNWRTPLDFEPAELRRAALQLADAVELHSGHVGLGFTYDQWNMYPAFDEFHKRTKRYLCPDIEHLGSTLPVAADGIKQVGWVTLLGASQLGREGMVQALATVASIPGVDVTPRRHATAITVGTEPVAGDINRQGPLLAAYYRVGEALAPFMLKDHPDLPGARFSAPGETTGWIHRFADPQGWR